MLSLVLAVVVSQTPETVAVRDFIDRNLISFDSMGWQATLRRGEHKFSIIDEDWASEFELVPEAKALAMKLKANHQTGMAFFQVGTLIEVGAIVGLGGLAVFALAVGTAAISITAYVAIAFVLAGIALVGAVISVMGIPALAKAQTQMFELVSTYNHGLARGPELPERAPLLPLPLVPTLQASF